MLAERVPKDKLYPLEIESGLSRSDRCARPASGSSGTRARCRAQRLADKGFVLGRSGTGGCMQVVAEKGAPLRCEWDEESLQSQYWGVLKGAKNNTENAQTLHRFACQPEMRTKPRQVIPYDGRRNGRR